MVDSLPPFYGYDMMSADFLRLIVQFLVIVIPVVLAFLFLIFLLVRKGGNKDKASRVKNADETRLIQEIHQGLLRMEQRIEALETILLEAGERREP